MDLRSQLPDIAFGPRQAGAGLRQILAVHCAQSGAAYAALLEESGFLYADAGDESLRDQGEAAALAVGAWHATRELAHRFGETNFNGITHEGRDRHLHISPVDERFLLLTVFNNDTKLALIRATAFKAVPALREALAAGAGPDIPPARQTSVLDGDIRCSSEAFLAAQ
jgi:predicted regulator of Ras-like GTPase activity (Roadblock/LC7/MglB family)